MAVNYMDPGDQWLKYIQPFVSGDARGSTLNWAQNNPDYEDDVRRFSKTPDYSKNKYLGLSYANYLGVPEAEDEYNRLLGRPVRKREADPAPAPAAPSPAPYQPQFDAIPNFDQVAGLLKDLSSIPKGGYGGSLPGGSGGMDPSLAWGGGGLLNQPVTTTPNFLNFNNDGMNNFINSFQSAWQPKILK